jgi:acyl carrier protein
MKYQDVVSRTAKQLGLLDPKGRLQHLDSLTMIDFVLELEGATSVSIPTASLGEAQFESIESVAQMLEELES